MIIDKFGGYVCRLGKKSDIPQIIELITPLVMAKESTEALKRTESRKVAKNTKFFVTNHDSLIVEKNGELIGAYLGKENNIVHIGNKYTDVVCMAILMHNVLNCVHNKFKESEFKLLNNNYKNMFTVSVFGEEATAINKFGDGIITLKGKQNIEYLYGLLKDKYDTRKNIK